MKRWNRFVIGCLLSWSCLVIQTQAALLVVTNTASDGIGTLRWAITQANLLLGADDIIFQVPTVPAYSGISIHLTNGLPPITDPVTIDGTTQTSNQCPPGVEIEGSSIYILSTGNGLNIQADHCTIRGLVINRFPLNGILIGDTNGNNMVVGCYIGTDTNGTTALPNEWHGIMITNSPQNKIGYTPLTNCAERNIIAGNNRDGVYIYGMEAQYNLLQNNHIGVDVTGQNALPNQWHGVELDYTLLNNVGSAAAPKPVNVISANRTNGVYIHNSASQNILQGNHIGPARYSDGALGNGVDGVLIEDAGANTVGNSGDEGRNFISANADDGVEIRGSSSVGNTVHGNYIGVTSNGLGALPNQDDGVVLIDDCTQNTIGGTTVFDPNLVSGNRGCGVKLEQLAHGNFIQGNDIGLNRDRAAAIPNAEHGVLAFDGAYNNWIGHDAIADAGNYISGNGASSGYNGVTVLDSADNTVIAGNVIGLGINSIQVPNEGDGVHVRGAVSNTIGGTDGFARNVISANKGDGIQLGTNTAWNVVIGNYIGTCTNGVTPRGNGMEGIFIYNASENKIGDTAAGAGNLIAANTGSGIKIGDADLAQSNQVVNCLVGTDVTGATPLGNSDYGIWIINAPRNQVGRYYATNVISGNGIDGIRIQGTNAIDNEVVLCYIGTDIGAMMPIANGDNGITLLDASNTTIGQPGGRWNVIAGNGLDGIQVMGSNARRNIMEANRIGVDLSSTVPIPNGRHGVLIWNNACDNYIGTNTSSRANMIMYNGGDGVRVLSGTNNAIMHNGIRGNTELGIDLGPDGVTTNDLLDPDFGANFLQNFPDLYTATTNTGTRVKGRLNSLPSTAFTIQFFRCDQADPSGYGEGYIFLHETNITTDASGNYDFDYTLTALVDTGMFITATARDPFLNSSEFSKAIEVLPIVYWDDDGDGMPTTWESGNHLDPYDSTGTNGAAGDPDTDEVDNYDEYIADTDPSDAGSYLHLTEIVSDITNSTYVTYTSTNTRYYLVQCTTNLLDAPSTWTNLYAPAIVGSNSETRARQAVSSEAQRYRVEVGLSPW